MVRATRSTNVVLVRFMLDVAQVSGNCMGIVGTVISVIIFRNAISIGGVVGYGITIGTTATTPRETLKFQIETTWPAVHT